MLAKSVEFRGDLVYLAIALLVILNRSSVPTALRNKGLSNVLLGVCFLLFGFLAVLQVKESVMGLLG